MGDQQPPAPPPPAASPSPMSPQGVPLAEGWKRLVSGAIDFVVVVVPSWILGAILGSVLTIGAASQIDPLTGLPTRSFFATWFLGNLIIIVAVFVLGGLYFALMQSRNGQTLGKMAMKIKVVDEATGNPPTAGKSFLRWVIPGLGLSLCFGIVTLLSQLWPLWDVKRQALHDKMANTLVVEAA